MLAPLPCCLAACAIGSPENSGRPRPNERALSCHRVSVKKLQMRQTFSADSGVVQGRARALIAVGSGGVLPDPGECVAQSEPHRANRVPISPPARSRRRISACFSDRRRRNTYRERPPGTIRGSGMGPEGASGGGARCGCVRPRHALLSCESRRGHPSVFVAPLPSGGKLQLKARRRRWFSFPRRSSALEGHLGVALRAWR